MDTQKTTDLLVEAHVKDLATSPGRVKDQADCSHVTPTDDEREALSEFLFTVYDHGSQPNALKEADAILAFLAAGFHSTVQGDSKDLRVVESPVHGEPTGYVDVVFDRPPEAEAGRFVEVEDYHGRGIRFGHWVHRPDGYWVLRIPRRPVQGEHQKMAIYDGNETVCVTCPRNSYGEYMAWDQAHPQGEPSLRDHVRNLTGASDAELDALGGFTGDPSDAQELIAEADALVESWDRKGSWSPDSPVGLVMRLADALRAAAAVQGGEGND